MSWILALLILAALATALAYLRSPGWGWVAGGIAAGLALQFSGLLGPVAATLGWLVFIALAVVLNVTALRRKLLSNPILAIYRRIAPSISQTEREALFTIRWRLDGDKESAEGLKP